MLSTLALWSRRRRQRRDAAHAAARRVEYDARVARARHRLALVGWPGVPDPRPVDSVAARRDPATRVLPSAGHRSGPDPSELRRAR